MRACSETAREYSLSTLTRCSPSACARLTEVEPGGQLHRHPAAHRPLAVERRHRREPPAAARLPAAVPQLGVGGRLVRGSELRRTEPGRGEKIHPCCCLSSFVVDVLLIRHSLSVCCVCRCSSGVGVRGGLPGQLLPGQEVELLRSPQALDPLPEICGARLLGKGQHASAFQFISFELWWGRSEVSEGINY